MPTWRASAWTTTLAFQLGSREQAGAAKPQASIFHAACARLDVAPGEVLHVGDHVEMDVVGASTPACALCWINRTEVIWPRADRAPDLEFDTLAGLADWLDAPRPRATHRAA